MKVIFLDIDGVLNTNETFAIPEIKYEFNGIVIGFNLLDPKAIKQLNRVIEVTKAKIVISSSWRIGCSTPEKFAVLCTYLCSCGVKGEIIGHTPINFSSINRGTEIQIWLDENEVNSFVIVDDDADMLHLMPKLVQTTWEGITEEVANKMIEILEM